MTHPMSPSEVAKYLADVDSASKYRGKKDD